MSPARLHVSEIAWKTLNAILLKYLFAGEYADLTLDRIKEKHL